MPRLLRLLSFVLMTCLAACSSPNKGVAGKRAVVSATQTPFYKYGPAQTFGPDFVLQRGAVVTILESSWGYTRVMTQDGSSGFVAGEDLRLAPIEAPSTAVTGGGGSSSSANSRAVTTSSGRPRHSDVQPTPGSPLFESGDLPTLPQKNETPASNPNFRF